MLHTSKTISHISVLEKEIASFKKQGFLIIENALSSEEVSFYKTAVDELAKRKTGLSGAVYLRESDIIELDLRFSELLDHPFTYPYVKELMGEHVRIMSTEALIRPREGDDPVRWHDDGPDCPPYRSLCTPPPLCQLKIGYFLTELPDDDSGNLVVLPGSHLFADAPPATLPQGLAADGAISIKVKAGSAVLFHNALYHCVQPNLTNRPRYCLYYAYCFPWMAPFDRNASSAVLHSLLKGERKRLLMDFDYPSYNYSLLRRSATWRGNPSMAFASPVRLAMQAGLKRLKALWRKAVY